jgi:hypothetical protein
LIIKRGAANSARGVADVDVEPEVSTTTAGSVPSFEI